MNKFLKELFERYPALQNNEKSISTTYEWIVESLRKDGTLFTCGNGGSASDSEHIVGELLKGFMKKRPIPAEQRHELTHRFGDLGEEVGSKLQGGLKAVALTSHPALATAFLNDVDGSLIYAQQLYALGRSGDVLIGITTSGNADNIYKTFMVAKIKGIKTILMTGSSPGRCVPLADCVINVPAEGAFRVQEFHLPVYHTLCMMIEEYFYEN